MISKYDFRRKFFWGKIEIETYIIQSNQSKNRKAIVQNLQNLSWRIFQKQVKFLKVGIGFQIYNALNKDTFFLLIRYNIIFDQAFNDYLFDLNVFLKHFTYVQVWIFVQSSDSYSELLPILMFTRMATEIKKRAHFKYVIKSKLFSTYGFITHSASFCLMTYLRCRQHLLSRSPS